MVLGRSPSTIQHRDRLWAIPSPFVPHMQASGMELVNACNPSWVVRNVVAFCSFFITFTCRPVSAYRFSYMPDMLRDKSQ